MYLALNVQLRVIWALILKDVRLIHSRKALGYIWALIDPVLQIVYWLVFVTVFRQNPPIGSSAITFLATGLLPILIFTNTCKAMSTALHLNKQFMHYPFVRPNDVLISRFVLEVSTLVVVMIILFSVLIFFGESNFPHDILRAVEAVAFIIALTLGFGIFFAYLLQVSPIFLRPITLFTRLVYFLSGIFFVPDLMPTNLRNMIWFNPMAHGVEMFRSAYYPSFESSMPRPSYIFVWAICLILAGLMLSSVGAKRSRYS